MNLVEGAQYFETWQKFWRVTPNTGSAQSGSGTVGGPIGGGGGDGGGGGGSSAPGPIYIGGERQVWLHADATWRPIPGFVDVLLDAAVVGPTVTVRCQSWVLAAGMTINVRLSTVSDVVVGVGTATAATGATQPAAFQEFVATVASTPQYYRMEAIVTGTSGEGAVAGVVAYPPGVAMRRRRLMAVTVRGDRGAFGGVLTPPQASPLRLGALPAAGVGVPRLAIDATGNVTAGVLAIGDLPLDADWTWASGHTITFAPGPLAAPAPTSRSLGTRLVLEPVPGSTEIRDRARGWRAVDLGPDAGRAQVVFRARVNACASTPTAV